MAQIELLADMCRNRSQLPIVHLERSFPYSVLLNLACNMLLPRRFKAACLGLVQVRQKDSRAAMSFYLYHFPPPLFLSLFSFSFLSLFSLLSLSLVFSLYLSPSLSLSPLYASSLQRPLISTPPLSAYRPFTWTVSRSCPLEVPRSSRNRFGCLPNLRTTGLGCPLRQSCTKNLYRSNTTMPSQLLQFLRRQPLQMTQIRSFRIQ